jgi:hypothetical protein
MITPCDRGARNCLRVLTYLSLAWLLAGVAVSSLRYITLGDALLSSGCSGSSCLRLPENTLGASFAFPEVDFASTARGDEPAAAVEEPAKPEEKKEAAKPEAAEEESDGVALFDGKTLEGWKESEFAGQGNVEVVDGEIRMGFGQDLTGITWDGDELPTTNYEIELEAKRVDGADFFCGLTFPVDDKHCSLILGGWGGTIVGLSSIDRFDASMIETTKFKSFERDKWYKVRLRVTPKKIEAWIDDEQVVDFEIEDHKISVRVEVYASRPLGIASWQTSAALRNLRMRRLDEAGGDKPSVEEAKPRE